MPHEHSLTTCMYTLSYLYGVDPLFKDLVIIQAWQKREGELILANSISMNCRTKENVAIKQNKYSPCIAITDVV